MKPALLLAVLLTGTLSAAPLHLDLEMTSEEYQTLLTKLPKSQKADDPAIAEALKLGERLSKWIAKINERRSPENAIRLTSAQTRRGIPIDKPNKYSPELIKAETATILRDLPQEMKVALTSASELPDTITISDESFITNARRLDRNYQSAARYKGVDQYRSSYIIAAANDVRGFYYLTKNNITDRELRDAGTFSPAKLAEVKEALNLVCVNSLQSQRRCRGKVEEAMKANALAEFYLKHIEGARRVWNSFFRIPGGARRTDVRWAGSTMTVPFNTPEIPKFGPYLKDNVEDEFRWQDWGLRINMGRFPKGPYLKFEPGVVPHVNELGGNQIVMDSNQPIEEYESQWTIRHEFGHVLGFPDCYHEFYDVSARAYVNYQLDITDLMCSRAGNMNERIYLELKGAYAK